MSAFAFGTYYIHGKQLSELLEKIDSGSYAVTLHFRRGDTKVKMRATSAAVGTEGVAVQGTVDDETAHATVRRDGTARLWVKGREGDYERTKVKVAQGKDLERTTVSYFLHE